MSSSSEAKKGEKEGERTTLLVSKRKDKRGRHLSLKVIHPLRFWRESLLRSHRADEKEEKCIKPLSLFFPLKAKRCRCDRGKRRTKLSKSETSTSLSPPLWGWMSFELKGRETYLSDLLRPTREVKILPPFPGFVVRHRLHLFVDFGRRHRDRGRSERIVHSLMSHRRHVSTPATDDGGSSGAMIFSRRRGRSRPSRPRRADE